MSVSDVDMLSWVIAGHVLSCYVPSCHVALVILTLYNLLELELEFATPEVCMHDHH